MTALLTLSDSVAAHARTQPLRLAARDSRRSLTWRDWDQRATRLADGLRALGLAKGDRVALLAYNALEWLEIYVALARSGLVAVPINFRLVGPDVAYIVQHAGAQAVIAQAAFQPLLDGLRGDLAVPDSRYVLFGSERATPGWLPYEALIAAAPRRDAGPPALPPVAVSPDDLFALMYTSGTTGRPKGAMRLHGGNTLIALATALEFGLTRDDTGLLVMPLCHANSLYFFVTFALLGATTVVDDSAHFDPAALLALLAREKVSFTSLVPTHYILMLSLPDAVKAQHDLSRVGKLLISSAPARAETKKAVLQLFPNGRLFELYGSTEAGWVTLLRPDEQLDHGGTVGREWAGTGAIKLIGDDGQEVADGEVGELFSRTPWAFPGYWQNPDKTAEAFLSTGPGSAEWCSVGDMARRNAQGFIELVDRKSNMIISGGENIYPSEVEAVLAAHPAVQDVAVIGVPDATWGEAVMAVVVLQPAQRADPAAAQAQLDAWCRERLAGYKRPRRWKMAQEAEMPRTATGKLQHRRLREQVVAAG